MNIPNGSKCMTKIKKEIINYLDQMILIRCFENRIADLSKNKKIKTPVHLAEGEEAIAVGVCSNLSKNDIIFSNHRSHAHYLAKTNDIKGITAEIFTSKLGCSRGKGGSMHLIYPEMGFFGSSAIVGSSPALGAGVALANKIKKQKNIAVSFVGDGAMNEGIVYEVLNFSKIHKLPFVLVCENNGYSTHMPLKSIFADTDLCKKARSFGIISFLIDGNNVEEVSNTFKKAKKLIAKGQGPIFIEAITYRIRGHVGPNNDLDMGLRSKKELDYWISKCPIKNLQKKYNISNKEIDERYNKLYSKIDKIINWAEKAPKPNPEDTYKDVFSNISKIPKEKRNLKQIEKTYEQAIRDTYDFLLNKDKNTFLIGIGIKSPWYVGGCVNGLIKKYGENRIIDCPISENAVTGICVGAGLSGTKPILIQARHDFMYLSFDPLINLASNWNYMFGDRLSCNITIQAIINRGGEQGAQHSQSLHGMFAHVPGLKVVAPSNATDVSGLLVSSVDDPNPVILIDDKWLYNTKSKVPINTPQIPIGLAKIVKTGTDLTIISNSYLVTECLKATNELKNASCEIIDVRTIKPLDKKTIINSVSKTKNVLIVDGGWKTNGFSSEVAAVISESEVFKKLKNPIYRLCLPDTPAPANSILEKEYFVNSEKIKNIILKKFKGD